MTNLKQRARDLLHSEDLRGRVPDEVQQFLRDVLALEPVGFRLKIGDSDMWGTCHTQDDADWFGAQSGQDYVTEPLYTLGADHDPA